MLRTACILLTALCLAATPAYVSTPGECDCSQGPAASELDAGCECPVSQASPAEAVTCACCPSNEPAPEPAAPPLKSQDTRQVRPSAQTVAAVEVPDGPAVAGSLRVAESGALGPLFSEPLYLRIEHLLN